MPAQHGGINIRIHHHIGAIADNHDGGAVFIGHRGAPPSGDFIAHAGKAKLGVYRIGGFDAPAFIHFTRRAARRGDHQIFCFGIVLHHFNHLRVGGYMRIAGFLQLINQAVPFGHFIAAFLHPSARGRPVAQSRIHFAQGFAGIPDHRDGAVFGGIKARCIDRNELGIGFKAGPRPSGEILQTGAYRHNHICLGGHGIGGC